MIALFFDTETTGIKTWKDPEFKPALVQLGAILQHVESGRVLAEVNLIANQYQGKKIPAEAAAVHGITDDLAENYGVDPKLIDIIFAALLKKTDILVAHNMDYDLDIMHDNLPISWNHKPVGEDKYFCTMDRNVMNVKAPHSDKAKRYFSSKGEKPKAPYKVPSLMETYQFYFGTGFEGAHDAMADIRACRDIFFKMVGQHDN